MAGAATEERSRPPFQVIGTSAPQRDGGEKVTGRTRYLHDLELPRMVHARNVRPPVAGAKLTSIDESSVRGIPGFVKVVSKGNYVAVVCEREEQAIRAAQQLKVEWQKPAAAPFPTSEGLFQYIREAKPTSVTQSRAGAPDVDGNPDAALAGAAKVVEAEYEYPFQGHTAIGPAHAMAELGLSKRFMEGA